MSSQQYITAALLDGKVAFQSKNLTDLIKYNGVISGIVTYQEALKYTDVVTYTAAVQQQDPSVGPANTLNYFLIDLINGTGQTQTYAFANEWISIGSFAQIADKVIVNIAVYDAPTNNHQLIINQLQALGFFAELVSVTS